MEVRRKGHGTRQGHENKQSGLCCYVRKKTGLIGQKLRIFLQYNTIATDQHSQDTSFRCCGIKVDSAIVASQNGFCYYKLSIHKKTNIIQITRKNITFFISSIFYHRKIVKLYHFMTLSLNYVNTVVLWCSHCKIHRFVAAPIFNSTVFLNFCFRQTISKV